MAKLDLTEEFIYVSPDGDPSLNVRYGCQIGDRETFGRIRVKTDKSFETLSVGFGSMAGGIVQVQYSLKRDGCYDLESAYRTSEGVRTRTLKLELHYTQSTVEVTIEVFNYNLDKLRVSKFVPKSPLDLEEWTSLNMVGPTMIKIDNTYQKVFHFGKPIGFSKVLPYRNIPVLTLWDRIVSDEIV